MVSKEEIDRIRGRIQAREMAGGLASPKDQSVIDGRALLEALDNANKRIAKLEADLDCVAPRQKSIGTIYLTPGETIEKLEAKLAKAREWAMVEADADIDTNDLVESAWHEAGQAVLAILDGDGTL